MNKISAIESSRLVVTYRPVDDLIPDPRNARTVCTENLIRVDDLMESPKLAE